MLLLYGTLEELYSSEVTIENTGNTVIKNQQLRFKWSNSANVLEPAFEPNDVPELGISMIPDPATPSQAKYVIGQIEKRQSVTFTFLLSSGQFPDLEIYPSNVEGNVDFVLRTSRTAINERAAVMRFVKMYAYLVLLPPLADLIPVREFAGMAAALIRGALLIAILPTLEPLARALGNFLTRPRADEDSPSIVASSGAQVVRIGRVSGNVLVQDRQLKNEESET
jgi:hypothetical protein